MKAIRIHFFGGPEVLTYEEVPRPAPGAGEVLIRVHAAGVNPVDAKIRSGRFPRYKPALPAILGRDVSGVVESVGSGVTNWHPGDAVFGMLDYARGTYAEYTVASSKELVAKPAKVEHVQAAAIPVAGLTAWQALYDCGGLTQGKRVLIHGGGGGVGHFAVQFALLAGAEVFTTAHPQDIDFLESLGAKHVMDYKSERFENQVRDMDLVLDLIGGETRKRSWQVLSTGGALVSTVAEPLPAHHMAGTAAPIEWWKRVPGDAIGPVRTYPEGEVRDVVVQSKSDQLAEIGRLVNDGKVRVIVTETQALIMAKDAHAKLEGRHFPGKMVLTVA